MSQSVRGVRRVSVCLRGGSRGTSDARGRRRGRGGVKGGRIRLVLYKHLVMIFLPRWWIFLHAAAFLVTREYFPTMNMEFRKC